MIKTLYLNPIYAEALDGYNVEHKKLFDMEYLRKLLAYPDIDIILGETVKVCRSPDLFVSPFEKFVPAFTTDVVAEPIDTKNLVAIAVDKDAVILYAGQKESLQKGSTVENVLTAMASVMPLETLLQTPLYKAYVSLDT